MKNSSLSYMIIYKNKERSVKKMKKILIIACLFTLSGTAFAICSITGGACTTSVGNLPSNVTQSSNLEQAVPDNLRNQLRTDAFQHDYRKPYYDALINTESANEFDDTQSYNSNCQFGVCLPGGEFNPSTGGSQDIFE